MKTLKQVLMDRDELTSDEADEAIADAREGLLALIEYGEDPFDFCADVFGLEPDYLNDLLF